MFGSVRSDLMRAPGYRAGLQKNAAVTGSPAHPEVSLCFKPSSRRCLTHITIPCPGYDGSRFEFSPYYRPIRQHDVRFRYLPDGKLLRKGTIGCRSFAENHQTACFLVEAMNDSQR